MKAVEISKRILTLTQPWAWLVCNRKKPFENRKWRSHFTGRILIHSALDESQYDELAGDIYRKHGLMVPLKETIDFGAVVGWAVFDHQVSESKSKWFTGPYAWPIVDAGAFPQPAPKLRGFQRIWRTPEKLTIKTNTMIKRKAKQKKAPWTTMPNARTRPATVKKFVYIARRTPKKQKENAAYNRAVKIWLQKPANRVCRVSLKRNIARVPATQCHHKRGRLGALLMDKRFWIPVSDEGHKWIDANRMQARRLGLSAKPGEWHKVPK